MSLFWAKRKVRDPRGEWWELYVTRTAMPHDPNAPGAYSRNTKLMDDPLGFGWLLGIPLAIIQFVGSSIVMPVLGLLFSYGRGRRTGAVRIEAVSYFGPHRETKYWTTTRDQLESVVDEIAAGLEAGKVVQPTGAVYVGSRDEIR